MNWTHFLLWTSGVYCLYYLTNILLDLNGGARHRQGKSAASELTFAEDVVPYEAQYLLENDQNKSAADTATELIGSGGVLLKDVFSLARKEVIVYTRQVSF